MRTKLSNPTLSFLLVAWTLSACSGSGSSDGASVSLAVTDAASDELSTFTIGLESVELQSLTDAPVSLLPEPTAVDFAALSDLSRVLNVTSVPTDTYTGVEVTLVFDNERVHVHGENQPANLIDPETTLPLTGTLTLTLDFPDPLEVTTGNHVIELDLDLNQSVDAVSSTEVHFEPALVARVDRADPKEHAIGGNLRTVLLGENLFRIGLEAPLGDPTPVVEVEVGSGTVFQVDGVCLLGAAGLSTLDTLAPGSWVQAFGSVDGDSRRFQAETVEAGHGSYNGGTDIVEGVITARSPDADPILTVRGHSSNADHTVLEYNLNYRVNTSQVTKVVRRGSATLYDVNDLNIGQRVRMFGLLDKTTTPHSLFANTATDVVRMEPTWVAGTANETPTSGKLEITLTRVDLHDAGDFTWSEGGATPADPAAFVLGDPGNLATGKGIVAGKPVVARGFFSPVDDAGADLVADLPDGKLDNRERLPSLLLIRDRPNGLTVTPTTLDTEIDFAFTGASAGFEKAVVDQGFLGETDVVATGITVLPGNPSGLGLYTLRDRTLNTLSIHLTFSSFSQGLEDALNSGATLFNFGALGVFDSTAGEIESALAGAVVR